MDAYRSAASWKAISDFRAAAGFGDSGELALRILPQLAMRRILLQKHHLLGVLAALPCRPSRDEHILGIVAKVDPLVPTLIRRLTAADEVAAPAVLRGAHGAAAAGGGAGARSRSPLRPAMNLPYL
ncbi:unnamed protein product [Prorocentrum cordatum]|uniref:Uncharacterized protein n=1 Tax=Prorocentrum cordatum TaxID=2364126 RepID=A0ABN9X5T0_9DINO|nr:unnamed protein product [Polarella glacialis]